MFLKRILCVLYTTALFEGRSIDNRAKDSTTEQLTPTTAGDRIKTMSKQNLLKCLYCDYRSSDKEERKSHLKEKHYAIMIEIAKRNNETIDWAAGYTASHFTKDDPES